MHDIKAKILELLKLVSDICPKIDEKFDLIYKLSKYIYRFKKESKYNKFTCRYIY